MIGSGGRRRGDSVCFETTSLALKIQKPFQGQPQTAASDGPRGLGGGKRGLSVEEKKKRMNETGIDLRLILGQFYPFVGGSRKRKQLTNEKTEEIKLKFWLGETIKQLIVQLAGGKGRRRLQRKKWLRKEDVSGGTFNGGGRKESFEEGRKDQGKEEQTTNKGGEKIMIRYGASIHQEGEVHKEEGELLQRRRKKKMDFPKGESSGPAEEKNIFKTRIC